MVRGRRVLLDDEGARADAADRELLVALDLPLRDVDPLHLRPARPLAEPLNQRVDRLIRPLGMDEHGPVLLVPHPAEHPARRAAARSPP